MAYIFFDIDGTLWDEKMQIPESTIPTIKQLQKNGHKTFLCSGRSVCSQYSMVGDSYKHFLLG